MRVLADTHALLWWRGEPARLSPTALRELERADPVLLSPISIWEMSTLLRLKRIRLDRGLVEWVTDLFGEGIAIAEQVRYPLHQVPIEPNSFQAQKRRHLPNGDRAKQDGIGTLQFPQGGG